jgi:YaiO family outer membrane protein
LAAPFLSLVIATAVFLAGPPQSLERREAERLARTGRHAEALAAFERMAATDPADVESRLWIGRLQLWMGRTNDAEATFRAILQEHPADVDARIGLGSTLTRTNRTDEAIALLESTRADAGENADLSAALARAYRNAGRPRAALEQFARAHELAPNDPDILDGLEAVRRTYDHSIAVAGYGETAPDAGWDSGDGAITLRLRANERLYFAGAARMHRGNGVSDSQLGGGLEYRAGKGTLFSTMVLGGPGNESLPEFSAEAQVTQYSGTLEIGAGVRVLKFATTDVTALSASAAWDEGGRWRSDARYTYSRSSFEPSDRTAGDHSILLRALRRQWRRVWIETAYAHGAESFDVLTADRVDSFDADTVAIGLRILTPSLLMLTSTWEHQWRSNSQTIDRLTCTIVQHF